MTTAVAASAAVRSYRSFVLRHRSEGLREIQHLTSPVALRTDASGVGRRSAAACRSTSIKDVFRDRSIAVEDGAAGSRGLLRGIHCDAHHAAPEAVGEIRRSAEAQLPTRSVSRQPDSTMRTADDAGDSMLASSPRGRELLHAQPREAAHALHRDCALRRAAGHGPKSPGHGSRVSVDGVNGERILTPWRQASSMPHGGPFSGAADRRQTRTFILGRVDGSYAFVSYVREDSDPVDRLCAELRRAGIAVWRDKDSLWPGGRWKDEIRRAIQGGVAFVACFSTQVGSRDRSYMFEELIVAVEELRQHPPTRRWFIPVRLDACELPQLAVGGGETISSFQCVDLFPDWDAGMSRLARAITTGPIEPYVDPAVAQTRADALIPRLSSPKEADRIAAAEGLAELAVSSDVALKALTWALLTEDSGRVVHPVAAGIASAGRKVVDPMVSLMAEFLEDPRDTTKARAAMVLGLVGPDAAAAAPLAAEIIRRDPVGDASRLACEALEGIGPPAVTSALELAQDPHTHVRAAALRVLAKVGQPTEVAPLALAELAAPARLGHSDVRSAAVHCLTQMDVVPESVIPVLIEALPRQPDWVAAWITRALAEHGPLAAAAIPQLERELRNSDRWTRGESYPYDPVEDSAAALGSIGPASVDALLRTLADGDNRTFRHAARALGVIGPVARLAVPQLCESDEPEP